MFFNLVAVVYFLSSLQPILRKASLLVSRFVDVEDNYNHIQQDIFGELAKLPVSPGSPKWMKTLYKLGALLEGLPGKVPEAASRLHFWSRFKPPKLRLAEIVPMAKAFKQDFPEKAVPFEAKLVDQAKEECEHNSLAFDRLAASLIDLCKVVSQAGMNQIVDNLKVQGSKIQESEWVFELVHCLLKNKPQEELLKCFPSVVVALLRGKEFCLRSLENGGWLDAKGVLWDGGPGWYAIVNPVKDQDHDQDSSQIWSEEADDPGHSFKIRSRSGFYLEGGRRDWNDGPSYHATSHPEDFLDTAKEYHKWRITPMEVGFKINNLVFNRVLSGEGKHKDDKNEATVEDVSRKISNRGQAEDSKWYIWHILLLDDKPCTD